MSDQMSLAKEKISIAKSILLTVSKLKLFGALLYNFNIIINPNTPMGTAHVQLDPKSKKLEIHFSPQACEEWDIKELVFVFLHEISHVLLKHLSRMLRIEHQDIANAAMDHVINKNLKKDIDNRLITGVQIPEKAFIIKSLEDANMSWEEVYEYLLKHAEIKTRKIISNSNSNSSTNQNQNQNQDGQENQDGQKDRENSGDVEVGEVEVIDIKLPGGEEYEFIKDIKIDTSYQETQEKEIQDNARRLINSEVFKQSDKTKGDKSSNLYELIESELEVKIPWDNLLENVIKKNIKSPVENKSWSQINKRLKYHNYILPSYTTDEIYENMYIIVDTSGSIGSEDLRKFANIIKNSMYHFKNVIKIDHDTNIKDVTIYNNEEAFDILNDQFKFEGRGGTSHEDVYNLLEDIFQGNMLDKYEEISDLTPGLILFLTDYESDIQYFHHKYDWPKEVPYKYILTEDHEVNPEIDPNPIYIN